MQSGHYRADIDGLPAISALSVLGFHARIPGFRGGFVGVDIFFVICGYLITGILIASSDEPIRRRLSDFYMRRCRRILPALLALLLVVTCAVKFVLPPLALVSYGRYLSFTTVLLTNVAAWTDTTRGWPVLVHLWTIAVEEQFYLAYPLFLFMAVGVRVVAPALPIGLLAVASFVLCVWASYVAPTANLYLTPTRIWELLLGALLTLSALRVSNRIVGEVLAAASLIVVCAYSSGMRYPGVYALPPCFAAATLLATGRDHMSMTAHLLSLRAIVFTGLISSLYLWHAPVLALLEYRTGRPADAVQTIVLVITIYLLAALGWQLVERAFRSRVYLRSNGRFLALAAAINAALGIAGLLLWSGSTTRPLGPVITI
jgi:peptidoglycan/LPS O-acetylase OafA/YrhL